MEVATFLTTLSAVVVGWVLGELSHSLRGRRDRKATVGEALAVLLEFHHRFVMLAQALRHQVVHTSSVQSKVDIIFPGPTVTWERYFSALDAIARTKPILAYRLRMNWATDQSLQLLSRGSETSSPFRENLADPARSSVLLEHVKFLQEATRQLAWNHGCLTWWRVTKELSNAFELPEAWTNVGLEPPAEGQPGRPPPGAQKTT